MPVKLKITLIFLCIVMLILGVICGGVYYLSHAYRINTIETRLVNRAITTERFLSQKDLFDYGLVRRIDSLTSISLSNKSVAAYDYRHNKIYSYSDKPGDTVMISDELLDKVRLSGTIFFNTGRKEAVAFYNKKRNAGIFVVSSGEDLEGKQSLKSLRNILLLGFLVGNCLVLISGYVFSTSLLQPIQKIASDVAEISAQNLTRRIKTGTSRDEWFQLTNTLNLLLDRLQESFEIQTRFISNASHELSTPLTSISSQLEVSLQRRRDAGEYRLVMESIYQDVRHMSKLTQTLLEFAKASGSAGGLEITQLRIDEIILRMPSEIIKLNAQYAVTIEFGKLPDNEADLLVYGNEALLLTAIRNIIINACKYSEDHKAHIRLTVTDRIHIYIIDKGDGIPENEISSIFQPFYRVRENGPRQGFGLGLSLTDRIIKLHRGHISVASEKDVETCFDISLPSAKSFVLP